MTREMTDRELDCEIEARIVDRADAIASCPKCGSVVNEGMFFPGIGCTSQACDWKLSYRDGAKLARPYSSSIAHAWLVVEEMRKRVFSKRKLFLDNLQNVATNAVGLPEGKVVAWPDVFWYVTPRAICEAALAALESERAK